MRAIPAGGQWPDTQRPPRAHAQQHPVQALDGWDIVTLGQVTPTLSALSEDRQLWKKLCQYHFGEKQASGRLRP